MTLLEHGSVSDRPSQATLSHAQVSLQHRKCCVVEAIHLYILHACSVKSLCSHTMGSYPNYDWHFTVDHISENGTTLYAFIVHSA